MDAISSTAVLNTDSLGRIIGYILTGFVFFFGVILPIALAYFETETPAKEAQDSPET